MLMSQEMQAIVWIVAFASMIAITWALWRRTARQSLTVLFMAIGAIVIVGGGIPTVWWQINERLQNSVAQLIQMNDHRIASETEAKRDGRLHLEAEIEVIVPKLARERLQAIAHDYLKAKLHDHRLDIVTIHLRDQSRTLLYMYAYRRSLTSEAIEPWLQPTPLTTNAHLEEPIHGELEEYHTVTIPVTLTAKWASLQALLGSERLSDAWPSLDESLYDYIVVTDNEAPRMVLLFALVDEEFLQQYQSAGGHPGELGLLHSEIPTPSLLVLVEAVAESLFRVSDIALVQKRGESVRRYDVHELALNEYAVNGSRQAWVRLEGNFPNFPNLLAQLRPDARIVGLVRFPSWLDPYQGFQVYYGDHWASFGKKI
jgi:hypothetical protein